MGNQNQDRAQPSEQDRTVTRASENDPQTYSYAYGFGYYDPAEGYVMEYHGPFTGAGESGYHHSDERIKEQVIYRLEHACEFAGQKIDVQVKGGEVFLRGEVNNRRLREIANDIACSVIGVTDIRNELRVQRVPPPEPAATTR